MKDDAIREMNVVAIVKGEERYVFLFDRQSHGAMLKQLGRFAADPELSFTWQDAAELCKAARRLKENQ